MGVKTLAKDWAFKAAPAHGVWEGNKKDENGAFDDAEAPPNIPEVLGGNITDEAALPGMA